MFPVVSEVQAAPDLCHFALCQQWAEYLVSLPRQDAISVCSLHVTPVVTWGWTGETDDFPRIDRLAS